MVANVQDDRVARADVADMRLLMMLLLMTNLRPSLDAFARKAMREIGTAPGMTVVVVKDDKVIYRGDFGWRDVEAKLPVTPDTRFYIASTTKAFTAMAAAILSVEGKLNLDAPIADAWPELKLTPPVDPKRISLLDLLAMRPGFATEGLNFRFEAGNVRDEADLLHALATYTREQPRAFQYSNLNYILAGRVMEKATGRSWRDLVREKILVPLRMNATLTGAPPPSVPVALPYRAIDSNMFVRTNETVDGIIAPAGGMLMTSGDAAKWLIAMMGNGKLPKRAVQLVQAEQVENKTRFRYIDRFAWGLGQNLGKYEGDLIVHRFGGLDGAYSHVSFMPAHRIGVAVFANGGGAVPDAVAAYAYDLLLGKKDIDAKWSAEIAKVVQSIAQAREQRRKAQAHMSEPHDAARPLTAYAGRYHYDRLGTIDVTVDNGRLFAQFGRLRAQLFPAGGDDFLIDWTDQGDVSQVRVTATQLDWGGRVFDRVQ
jgi:CubicO group peptidase (beta-lactamase class C family)